MVTEAAEAPKAKMLARTAISATTLPTTPPSRKRKDLDRCMNTSLTIFSQAFQRATLLTGPRAERNLLPAPAMSQAHFFGRQLALNPPFDNPPFKRLQVRQVYWMKANKGYCTRAHEARRYKKRHGTLAKKRLLTRRVTERQGRKRCETDDDLV